MTRFLLAVGRLRRFDARVWHVRTLFIHTHVVIPVIGDLVRGALVARGLERVERVLIRDLERPIAAREPARKSTRSH